MVCTKNHVFILTRWYYHFCKISVCFHCYVYTHLFYSTVILYRVLKIMYTVVNIVHRCKHMYHVMIVIYTLVYSKIHLYKPIVFVAYFYSKQQN